MEKNQGPPPSYGPPPQPGFVPPPQQVVIQQAPSVGPEPQNMSCPTCHASIQTRVQREASTKTHIIALLLCLFGCWCCVCCPYCMDSCQNANHYCPNCNTYVGSYSS